MLLPSNLARKPITLSFLAPEYDFDSQRRWDEPLLAGRYTSGSIQTFDFHGKPKDSQSDYND